MTLRTEPPADGGGAGVASEQVDTTDAAPEPAPVGRAPLRLLEAVVRGAAALFLVAIVLVILVGVVARFVFDSSLPWAEELPRLMLVWLTFLGAVGATARRANINVDTLSQRYQRWRYGRVFEIGTVLLSIAALGIWIWTSIDLFGPSANTISPATGLEARWTRMALPLAASLMIVFLAAQGYRLARGRPAVDKRYEDDEPPVEAV
jgi:TRAP-type transport system small permease protein